MSDIALLIVDNGIGPKVAKGDLMADNSLETAVLISLFTDKRADEEELPTGERSKRGWWGDMFPEVDQDQVGSKLWLLEREKTTEKTRVRAVQYAREALEWLIEDGVAEAVDVSAAYNQYRHLIIDVVITRPAGESRYSVLWDQQQGVRRI